MSVNLAKLPQTSLSGLSFDNIVQDIANMVKDSPDYNIAWDDFLSSDAGRMMVELFAYIADNLATRIDWNVNENFISTATVYLSPKYTTSIKDIELAVESYFADNKLPYTPINILSFSKMEIE